MDEDAQAALLELDRTCGEVAAALERCGQLVNEGRLDGNQVMLKMHELSARLMTGGSAPA